MTQFLFLREDLKTLEERIAEASERVKEALKLIGEGAESDSNTWHDNVAYDEGQRQNDMWSGRVQELVSVRRNAKIVEIPQDNNVVRVGKTITIRDETTGETQTFQIGSYLVLSERNAVSYHAPLGRLLLGARAGDVREGHVGPTKRKFKVLAIA